MKLSIKSLFLLSVVAKPHLFFLAIVSEKLLLILLQI